MSKKTSDGLESLLGMLDQGYNRTAWHGPNLRSSVRGVSPKQSIWRPGPKRKCIAEIAMHCAYWKYSVRRRILGEKRGSFVLKGSNWFAPAAGFDAAAWKQWLGMLEDGAWLDYARHANRQAQQLAAKLAAIEGVELLVPTESNAVFVSLPEATTAELRALGWSFYTFIGDGGIRFMTAWDTQDADVDSLVGDVSKLMAS